ncbi:DNA dC-_dU-editing enzyme APOBEC3 [Dasypus novemcinctus]|uniref:DNA dC->dU-editing enzyme APOBEC3 n=1 Tax=Dasypus novemcinctus TaxID=9361 RepID=UPI00265E96F0|nr:DNA dC->dU-editing enzyme APOBEC3 [Dasypus novemcinctus]
MEPEGPVPRGRPGASLGGSGQAPQSRNPKKMLSPEEFAKHFDHRNFEKSTCLCYQVESGGYHHSPVLLERGVIQNEGDDHAESLFLRQWRELLSPDRCYRITWYISWSPCRGCAEEVACFLEENRKVALSVAACRLYRHNKLENRQGLRRLRQAGTQIRVMSPADFKFCWENFVHHREQHFQMWKGLKENYREADRRLKDILGHLLKKEIFYVQFNNHREVQKPFRKRITYLCCKLKRLSDDGSIFDNICFQNKEGVHAEICFINKIKSMWLDERQKIHEITCYMTWSPCPDCASKLVEFSRAHPSLHLKIFAARLYFHWRWDYIKGLQQLKSAGIAVAVMSGQEFADCWRNFVDYGEDTFQPWQKLDQRWNSINRRLGRILKDLKPDDLNNDFRNLQLDCPGPMP